MHPELFGKMAPVSQSVLDHDSNPLGGGQAAISPWFWRPSSF